MPKANHSHLMLLLTFLGLWLVPILLPAQQNAASSLMDNPWPILMSLLILGLLGYRIIRFYKARKAKRLSSHP